MDFKPYTPSMDRVESPEGAEWCGHWPKSREESADFGGRMNLIFSRNIPVLDRRQKNDICENSKDRKTQPR